MDLKKGKKIVKLETEICGACKAMEPIWEKLESLKTNPEIDFVKINLDQYPEYSDEFEIRSVPTFLSIENGIIKHTIVGRNNLEKMKELYLAL